MKKILLTVGIFFLACLSIYAVRTLIVAEKIDWVEGHYQISPDKKWVVYIRTSSTHELEKSYCKILVFNTAKYPNLKEPGQRPTTTQENNPQTSYLLPIQFYARATDFEWSPDSNYVVLKQPSLNGKPSLAYKVDFKTFSLNEIKF